MQAWVRKLLVALAWQMTKVYEGICALVPHTDHIVDAVPTIDRSKRHWRLAIVATALVYSALYAVFLAGSDWLFLSVITTVGAVLGNSIDSVWPHAISQMIALNLAVLFVAYAYTTKPHAANTKEPGRISLMESVISREERIFREGAEEWNWLQRAWSCILFGVVHIVNLFVPYVIALILIIGGALFMWEYLRVERRTGSRKAALGASSSLHYCYNMAGLYGLVAYIPAVVVTTIVRGS